MKISEDRIIIVILIKLFAINIVANNFFGDLISWIINLCFFNLESFNLFLSVGVSENNATSDPEIKPEKINNRIQDKKGVKKI